VWESYWTHKKELVYQRLVTNGSIAGFNENAFLYFMNMVYKHYENIDEEVLDDVFGSIYGNSFFEQTEESILLTMIKVDPDQRDALFEIKSGNDNIITDQQYITSTFVDVLRKGFEKFVIYSLTAVFLVLWLFYGRIELAVITFLPIISAWSLTLALMNLFNIQFNIFNIMLASFVFGLGIDYCIFIMRGLQYKYETGEDELPTFRSSIYLSAFTTIIGTGVLMFAKHPAIHSLAFIAIFGIGSVLIIANTLQPFLFNYMVYKSDGSLRQRPVTLIMVVNTIVVFGMFISGSLALVIIRFALIIVPLPLRHKKYFFHFLIRWSNKILLNSVPYISRSYLDKHNIDYSNPSIIIANHQSYADILISLNFQTKMLLQTKDWVWNQLMLKTIVRFADYYPISFGLDHNIKLIKQKMNEGYSMLIYPEGSRSEDLEIKRFHKGAFNLSEKLKVDIQPILYHGFGYVMPKGEPFLNSDGVIIKFLPRILHSDRSWGDDYRSRSKSIAKYMRDEYGKMRLQFENTSYYRRKLISRFIYKGPVLEWYLRIKLRLENNYEFFHQTLPKKGLIYDIGCGYGFLSLMLKYSAKEREIIGLDYDEHKIEIAKNAEVTELSPHFKVTDVCMYEYVQADAFVLNDVLHYMDRSKQEKLLRKCLDQLKSGGVMIVRDADASKNKRHLGTRITEIISTGIGFNKKQADLVFVDESFFIETFKEYNVEIEKIDDTKFTSNQVFVIRKNNSDER